MRRRSSAEASLGPVQSLGDPGRKLGFDGLQVRTHSPAERWTVAPSGFALG